MKTSKCQLLISGAGPSGLCAALMFLQRGWKDIVLIERRQRPDEFERSKAFNYQLDGRGQRILSQLNIDADVLRQYGLPNDHFTLTNLFPDGSEKVFSPPILMPNRKTPYWMTRSSLLLMLHEALLSRNVDGHVTLLYDHRFEGFERHSDGSVCAVVKDNQDQVHRFKPRLTLGCDGLGSRVRAGLHDLGLPDFQMAAFPSPSSRLAYRVLSFPPRFPVRGHPTGVNSHAMAYAFHSTYTDRRKKLALFALPVANASQPRNVNIILPKQHAFWQLTTADDILAFLQEGFPQLDFESLIDVVDAEDFADLSPGYFPAPQHTGRMHATPKLGMECLLIGDAAHAFPPDLGLGVNSALEDLFVLNQFLDAHQDDVHLACKNYEQRRLPESRSLVRLVRSVHPYQYNQVPWRLKLWMVKFVGQLGLTRLTRGLIDPPGFVLSQHHRMNFVEMEQRYKAANTAFYAVAGVLMAAIGAGISLLF